MVDCITICNSACITCIWCILFSVWYDFVTASQSLIRKNMLEHILHASSAKLDFFFFFLVFQNSRKILGKWIRASVAYAESRLWNTVKYVRVIFRDAWKLIQFVHDDLEISRASNAMTKIDETIVRVPEKKYAIDHWENVETHVDA